MSKSLRVTLACCAAIILSVPSAQARKPKPVDHWVVTWATGLVGNPAVNPNAPAAAFAPGSADITLRQIVHTSLGGPLVRLELTNALGSDPLTLGPVHLALADPKTGPATGDIALLTANALTFNGAETITIPAGGEVISDPAALNLPAGADVVITFLLPAQKLTTLTMHNSAYQTNFYAAGNMVQERSLNVVGSSAPQTVSSYFFLKCLDVKTAPDTGAIVAFGDSITDGTATTPDANLRWPDVLAKRLQGAKQTKKLAVANEGIGGNRILHDGTGPSALARFDRDVLALPGVKYLIILEGINDIGVGYGPQNAHDTVTATDLTAGMAQLVERAHAHGIKVFGATLTPYMGAGYSSPEGETIRQALNTWIRSTKILDGMIDFDKATRDPAAPDTLAAANDHGDHLHPNDAGMKAMADSIDLALFAR